MTVVLSSINQFQSVSEWEDSFLSLFPHRYDYIYANHPEPGQSPAWKTESRHPLSDRLIRQGAYLFGVRFGKTTNYCLLDIDIESPYHPRRDRLAIARILAALEPLGLVSGVFCTSSDSGGIHLYFPFEEAQSSWELAIVIATLLENAGIWLKPGHLELFPNPRTYATDGNLSLFNAHRLPLQSGSYLLNDDFQPIWTDPVVFVQSWEFARRRNQVEAKTLHRLRRQFYRKHYQVSGKAEKFINDLNAEIELGWTGPGQTNRLLGRIAMRAYVFHHVLHGGEPLAGQALVDEIVATAQSLPGYSEWCRHRHEIQHRAEEWARCVESSHYFHYGEESGKYRTKKEEKTHSSASENTSERLNWNQQQLQATRERIRMAIADLLEKGALPGGATARFRALVQYRIGGASLYRHRDLWHPEYFSIKDVSLASGETPPTPPTSIQAGRLDRLVPSNLPDPTSLLPGPGSNPSLDQALSDCTGEAVAVSGSNSELESQPIVISDCSYPVHPQHLYQHPFAFAWADASQEASRLAHQQTRRIQNEARQKAYIDRMQRYLESGDPILTAEALAWAEINPGILQIESVSVPSDQGLAAIDVEEVRDLSDLLAAIAVQIARLRLTPTQVCDRLHTLFGKSCLHELEDMELARWRIWLEHQPMVLQPFSRV